MVEMLLFASIPLDNYIIIWGYLAYSHSWLQSSIVALEKAILLSLFHESAYLD